MEDGDRCGNQAARPGEQGHLSSFRQRFVVHKRRRDVFAVHLRAYPLRHSQKLKWARREGIGDSEFSKMRGEFRGKSLLLRANRDLREMSSKFRCYCIQDAMGDAFSKGSG